MIDERYIAEAARAAEIEIPPARLPAVLGNLQRTAEIAAALEGVALDPMTDEIGPVWRP